MVFNFLLEKLPFHVQEMRQDKIKIYAILKSKAKKISNSMGSLSAKVGLSHRQAIMLDIRVPLWLQ